MDNNTYSIKDIIHLLLSHIWLIILITVLGGAGAYAFSKQMLPLEYQSHITMYVQSYTGIVENGNAVNNISNSKQLVNTYMEVLKDDAVMNAVGEELQKQFNQQVLSENFSLNPDGTIRPASLRSCISISAVTDTSAVKLVATTKNAALAAAVCNNLTKVAPQYVEDAVGVGSINTIDTAKVYNSPVAPNVPKNTLMGMAAAFMLITMLIFIIDFFDNTVKDPDTLSNQYKKAIIGEIQHMDEGKKKNGKSAADNHIKLTDKDVSFNIVESYKSIRTNVTFSLSTLERKIFAVSSSSPDEGKSTIASNIAIALAQGGNKVLLIDADMRKSVIHKIFELTNKKGLSSAVSKMNDLHECIHKDVMDSLDVMTAGPIPPNPSELLASENMSVILDELDKEYDIIVIDTPPINIVTDAMELAKIISGLFLVVRYRRTTFEDVDAVIKKVEFAQINLLGFILNDIKAKNSVYSKYGKNKYYYKKGYGYGYYGSKPSLDDFTPSAKTDSTESSKSDTKSKDDAKAKNDKAKSKEEISKKSNKAKKDEK
ncbi:MAG: polysaccharide biosynthesis tyrosine autokinase [Ruminococcus sp.]|nr:polysaccharide biosynthesis tyrosine autokinase [Ruminococcus sp.]